MIEAFRFLDAKQNVVEDTHGNISSRGAHGLDGFYIKPSGMSYSSITVNDLVLLSVENIEFKVGHLKESVDSSEHRKIYKLNPQVKSICHTHSPYATAMAIAGLSLPVLCTEHADYFGHEIACLKHQTYDKWGEFVLEENEQAVLLGQHGVLICSHDNNPMSAVKLAVALEAIAKKYYFVWNMAGPSPLSSDEVNRWHQRYKNSYGQ
jgi:L-ribulose-5-phosphate 4-epimerase